MSDGNARPLVRPWFLGASAVVFILLIPVLVYSIWDSYELRRLDAAILAIERSGEPIHVAQYSELAGPAADADRYYRAAAALASGRGAKLMSNEFGHRLSVAERDDVWPPELVAELRSAVESYDEALALADRAAALPFESFAAGRTYSYLTADLLTILRAQGYRATVRALDGDAGGALASLYSETRLQRPLDTMIALSRLAADLRVVFAHVRPSSSSLANLGRALAEADHDDVPKRELVRLRALSIDGSRSMRDAIVIRPWLTHLVNRALAGYAAMIRASVRPWPDRIDAVIAAEYPPPFFPRVRAGGSIRRVVEISAEGLALLRAARMAVAVEQFQRDHAEQLPASVDELAPRYLSALPVDPFTGRPLRMLTDSRGYTVYSVGSNRRDDGGRELGPSLGGSTASPRVSTRADVGIRIERRN